MTADGIDQYPCPICERPLKGADPAIRGALAALEQLVQEWRETADAWERELARGCMYPHNKTGYQRPPQGGRGAIENWIIWLRSCAKDVEDRLARLRGGE